MDLSKATEQELLDELAKRIEDDLIHEKKDINLENSVTKKMGDVEGIHDYFRQMIAADLKLYFMVSSDHDRDKIRGAYERIQRIRAMILKSGSSLDIQI